jgi:hypothetical protein
VVWTTPNLRCPFCIVDYANVKGLRLMTRETFARAIELLPMMSPGCFWLSCLHEPTLHPQFIEFIDCAGRIPQPDQFHDESLEAIAGGLARAAGEFRNP